MSEDTCILTTKDFTILEIMLDRCHDRDDPLTPLLERKIASAQVILRADVPANIVTLGSRVTFSVDNRDSDTRVVTADGASAPVGLFLPVSSPRGLALLGLAEGQTFRLAGREGMQESIVLETLHYQPEAARREREAMGGLLQPARGRKPVLRVIDGALRDGAAPRQPGHDDPGPRSA